MQIPERWVIAQLWVIRHKPSGNYLPNPTFGNRKGRGGSHVEPVGTHIAQPRTFDSERSAKSALGHWLRGKVNCSRYKDDEVYELIPVPHRKREEMEIIPVVLIHKDF